MEPQDTSYIDKNYHPPSPVKKRLIFMTVLAIIVTVLIYIALNQRQEIINLWSKLIHQQSPLSQTTVPTTQAQVKITAKGFVPKVIMVKKETTVVWVNKDNKPHQIASDPHPLHNLLKGLIGNKPLSTGTSYSFTFNQVGTFTYHDELNPLNLHGTVIVK